MLETFYTEKKTCESTLAYILPQPIFIQMQYIKPTDA